ncbi:hypothetical protein BSKO_04279 [Bryopsis sp. KO-2023]|nr:hypothetical protein BSKO_04279 [Bryopsis sp. KO-2023]
MGDRGSIWPAVLTFGGAMIGCGLAMYAVGKLSEPAIDEEEELFDDYDEDYDLDMEYPQPDDEFDFHLDEEDLGEEDLSIITRSLINGDSSDENSQNEVNRSGSSLSWTQTQEEVMLEFQIPAHVKARDIQCKFNTNSISVCVEDEPILEGDLCMSIQPDGCSWEIDGSGNNRLLLVSLLKASFCPGFWTEVTKSAPGEINEDAPPEVL